MDIADDFLDILSGNSMLFRGEVVLKCAGCGRPLFDRIMLKVGARLWHSECLRCAECTAPLTQKCFERNEMNFCEEHFYRKFGTRCGACDRGILPLETVRRVRQLVFHVQCFACFVCRRELVTGDRFYLMDQGRLVCQRDYAMADRGGKRPRTCISSTQLDALKSAYRRSSKPSRAIREQLAAQTGLDMRVVQVWFQNRRAKEKRLKREVKKRQWDKKLRQEDITEPCLASTNIWLSAASDLRFSFLQRIICFSRNEL